MKNRIVMSAMTRGFADKNHCCIDGMSEYYERRAKNANGRLGECLKCSYKRAQKKGANA